LKLGSAKNMIWVLPSTNSSHETHKGVGVRCEVLLTHMAHEQAHMHMPYPSSQSIVVDSQMYHSTLKRQFSHFDHLMPRGVYSRMNRARPWTWPRYPCSSASCLRCRSRSIQSLGLSSIVSLVKPQVSWVEMTSRQGKHVLDWRRASCGSCLYHLHWFNQSSSFQPLGSSSKGTHPTTLVKTESEDEGHDPRGTRVSAKTEWKKLQPAASVVSA
jgi:hypothetical protein